jgi:restriction system protein
MNKRSALKRLARKRQRARWPGYKNIGDYHGGIYECAHVSPYTKSACNVDSAIMVFLQDWTSDESIRRGRDEDCITLGYTPALPTNRNLIRLLQAHFGVSLRDIFATNLFPFIKPRHMGHAIPRRDLVRAAVEFALPQIRIVRPALVICLGLPTFNALREACGQPRVYPLAEAIRSPFLFEGARIWCQAHTGGQGQAMRNAGRAKVPGDWRRMKRDAALKA